MVYKVCLPDGRIGYLEDCIYAFCNSAIRQEPVYAQLRADYKSCNSLDYSIAWEW